MRGKWDGGLHGRSCQQVNGVDESWQVLPLLPSRKIRGRWYAGHARHAASVLLRCAVLVGANAHWWATLPPCWCARLSGRLRNAILLLHGSLQVLRRGLSRLPVMITAAAACVSGIIPTNATAGADASSSSLSSSLSSVSPRNMGGRVPPPQRPCL